MGGRSILSVLGLVIPVHDYQPGTWGSPEAEDLTAGVCGCDSPVWLPSRGEDEELMGLADRISNSDASATAACDHRDPGAQMTPIKELEDPADRRSLDLNQYDGTRARE